MIEAKNVRRHVVDLGDGRMAAPGQIVEVDPDDQHIAGLLEDETLRQLSDDHTDPAGTPAPPRSGSGSGRDAWVRFATDPGVGIEVTDDMSRDDIIDAAIAAGVIEHEENR